MNRRKVIKVISLAAAAGVLLPTGMYIGSPGTKKYAEQVIIKTLDYLKLDQTGVSNFVNDYFKGDDINFKSNLRWKVYYFSATGVKRSDNMFELVRSYLLSSDFFINGNQTNRKINYLGLFNPYENSMPNPYSYIFLN